jgi:putative acetyltransferase
MKFYFSSPTQKDAIKTLFIETFSASEGESEGLLIGKLVDEMMATTAPEDLYGFVANDEEKIIAGIFFSRMSFEEEKNAFILSPVAVHPAYQRKKVGQRLINYGIEKLKDAKVELLFTYGDPNYYAKVGFQTISEDVIKAPLPLSYPHGWLAQSLGSDTIEPIKGKSQCVAALSKPEYW